LVFFEVKKRSKYVSKPKREFLHEKQRGKCRGCKKSSEMEALRLHHVGKSNRITDLQLLCPNCHDKAHEWKTKKEPFVLGKDRTLVKKRMGNKA